MAGDFLRRTPQITFDQYRAFLESRSEEERWELIDGVPIMMAPPTLVHQRIALNLMWLLRDRLSAMPLGWEISHDSGLHLPGDDRYSPEPDVIVIDAEVAAGQVYAERFYFTCEVLSGSDAPAILQVKLAYYQAHEHNRAILFVDQNRLSATLYRRTGPGSWQAGQLASADSIIDIPDIGPIGTLGALYRATPLDPFRRA